MNMFDIAVLRLVVPLKTFQKFCGLNADRFGKIAGSVELRQSRSATNLRIALMLESEIIIRKCMSNLF